MQTIKTVSKLLFCMTIVALVAVPAVSAATYGVDPVHTSVVFRIRHLNISYLYGRFTGVTGTLRFDEKMPAKSALTIKIKSANVDTANTKRDRDLKSANFFNAAKYPDIAFKSDSFTPTGKDSYEVKGHLTLLGVTQPLTVTLHKIGSGKDPWGNYRIGFESRFTLKRSTFGMNYLLKGVGDRVNLMVAIEAIRK